MLQPFATAAKMCQHLPNHGRGQYWTLKILRTLDLLTIGGMGFILLPSVHGELRAQAAG